MPTGGGSDAFIEKLNVSIESDSATDCIAATTLHSVVSFNGYGLPNPRFRISNVEVSGDRVCDALEIVYAYLGQIKQTILNEGTFAGTGIRMAGIDSNNDITRNIIHAGSADKKAETAILVDETVGVLIKHNTVTGGATGVHVAADSTETTIANNVLTGLVGSATGIVDDDVTCTTFIQNNTTITGYVTSVEQPNCQ